MWNSHYNLQWFDGDVVPKIADAAHQFEEHYLNFKKFQKENGYQIHAIYHFLTMHKRVTFSKQSFQDHDDITYDQACNASFHRKIELIQYNAAIAITGAIQGT